MIRFKNILTIHLTTFAKLWHYTNAGFASDVWNLTNFLTVGEINRIPVQLAEKKNRL